MIAPFANFLHTFSWSGLVLEQVPLQASNLQTKCVRHETLGDCGREIIAYAHLPFGDRIGKTFSKLGNFRLLKYGRGMPRRRLTPGVWKVLL